MMIRGIPPLHQSRCFTGDYRIRCSGLLEKNIGLASRRPERSPLMADDNTEHFLRVESTNIDIEDDDIMGLDEEETSTKKKKEKRTRRLSSVVWQYFERKEGKDKSLTVQCKACGKTYKGGHIGTGNMKRHLLVCARKDINENVNYARTV
ncbi:uncharacterized protein [Euphorbia lathyris]|uniref:uncharacterized protein n=1 Tax=Euphorbia lathyris TaxID=212925 RepID=UPI003313ECBF